MDRQKRRFSNTVLELRFLCKECYHIWIVYVFLYERAKRFKYARSGCLFPDKCGQGLRQYCNDLSSKGTWDFLAGVCCPIFQMSAPFFLMHFHSSLENHTCLQSKMGKFCIQFSDQNGPKMIPFGAAHTYQYMVYTRKTPWVCL